jgi:hypothetical protein
MAGDTDALALAEQRCRDLGNEIQRLRGACGCSRDLDGRFVKSGVRSFHAPVCSGTVTVSVSQNTAASTAASIVSRVDLQACSGDVVFTAALRQSGNVTVNIAIDGDSRGVRWGDLQTQS